MWLHGGCAREFSDDRGVDADFRSEFSSLRGSITRIDLVLLSPALQSEFASIRTRSREHPSRSENIRRTSNPPKTQAGLAASASSSLINGLPSRQGGVNSGGSSNRYREPSGPPAWCQKIISQIVRRSRRNPTSQPTFEQSISNALAFRAEGELKCQLILTWQT